VTARDRTEFTGAVEELADLLDVPAGPLAEILFNVLCAWA